MKHVGPICVMLMALSAGIRADEPQSLPPPTGKLVREQWLAATIDGVRAGHVHVAVHEIDRDGQKLFRATHTLRLTVKRFSQKAQMEASTGTDETPDGRVVGVTMRQRLGEKLDQVVDGTVEGDQLRVVARGAHQFDKHIPWNKDVLGILGELKQIETKKPGPGATFEYLVYEPMVNAVVRIRAKAEAKEVVRIGKQTPTLLRITAVPDEIQGVQLPGSTFWYDAAYQLVRSETRMAGLGTLTLERTTREDAEKPSVGPDLGVRQSIQARQRLQFWFESSAVVYRVTLPKDKQPETAFAQDARQTVKNPQGKSFDLHVQAVRQPPAVLPAGPRPGAEYLDSNFFVTSDDALVRKHAATAVGPESDPWRQAQMIERWVKANMKVMNFTEAMATASHVAQTLQGDCTEYSMLCAAMCRSVGVPSRTAVGLVYVDAEHGHQPFFGFHMWTEVWVRGQWLGLDATLGRGSVGPGHLKVTDHSWHNVRNMNPMLPVMRVMVAEPRIDILQERRESQ